METMEIVLFIANTILVWFAWYFIGRASIYRKLKNDYKEALTIIGKQQALIEAYKMKYNAKEKKEDNGEQD